MVLNFYRHNSCSRISREGNSWMERKSYQVSRANEDDSEQVLSAVFLASENLKGLVSGMSSHSGGVAENKP